MATDYASQIEHYKDLLKRSPTAGTSPTSSDTYNEKQVMKLTSAEERAESDKLKDQWYIDKPDEETKPKKGFIGQTLHGLAIPTYTVIGALETALGKGTKKGLVENIKSNIEEEGLSGDLLRQYGMKNWAAMPLGFALDVALDPVMWASLGTQALVPRVAKGLTKGGVKGAGLAVKSSALTKAESFSKLIPGLTKKMAKKTPTKFAAGYKKLIEKGFQSRTAYDKMIGRELPDILAKSVAKQRAGVKFSKAIEKTFGEKAKTTISNVFGYDPAGYITDEIASGSKVKKAAKGASDWVKARTHTQTVRKILNTDTTAAAKSESSLKFAEKIAKETSALDKSTREVTSYFRKIFTGNSKYLEKLKQLDPKGTEAMASLFNYYGTKHIESYNKVVAKALLSPKGRAVLDNYAKYIGLFKDMKIGLGLSGTGVNATVSNLAFPAMSGVDITPTYIKRTLQAFNVVVKKDLNNPLMQELLTNKSFVRLLKKNPDVVGSLTGIHPQLLLRGKAWIDDAAREATRLGMNADDIADASKDARRAWDSTLGQVRMPSGASINNGIVHAGAGDAFQTSEVLRGPFQKMLRNLEIKGETSPARKFLFKVLSEPLEFYGGFDQAGRIGFIGKTMLDGITQKEVIKLSKFFPISMKDVVQIPGKNLYKLNAEKAFAISSDIFMNYSALPDAVTVLRTIPFIGQPFGSFAYAFAQKAGKTAMYNPQFFNQMQFLLKEIGGEKSPAEVKALEGKYYSWMNRPGMMKLPFAKKTPMYMNVANMIPHYTMNFLQEPDRTYEEKFGSQVAKILDKLPIMKDPIGQIWFDYIIQPTILGIDRPQGMFGQPLWSKDAGFGEKIGRAGGALLETMVPPALDYLGLVTPEKLAKYAPSYRWRSIANAIRGKSSLGIKGTEPASSRGLRAVAAKSGFPMYPINLKYSK